MRISSLNSAWSSWPSREYAMHPAHLCFLRGDTRVFDSVCCLPSQLNISACACGSWGL